MNKNRGMWIVIACIVVIGAAVTFTTSHFVRERAAVMSETGIPQAAAYDNGIAGGYQESSEEEAPYVAARGSMTGGAPEMRAGGPDETQALSRSADRGAGPGAAPTDVQPLTAAEGTKGAAAAGDSAPAVISEEAEAAPAEAGTQSPAGTQDSLRASAVPEKMAAGSAAVTGQSGSEANVVLSPLGPGAANQSGTREETKEYYDKHLAEVDVQIQKMRAEVTDSSTYSMKNLAEKELQTWNLEMNSIYGTILKLLDEESSASLEKEQQAWLKNRDTRAEESARKYSGGSLEGVEYTASLAESTRERTYDLVAEYIDILPSEEQ